MSQTRKQARSPSRLAREAVSRPTGFINCVTEPFADLDPYRRKVSNRLGPGLVRGVTNGRQRG
jgi:hypothetical protein